MQVLLIAVAAGVAFIIAYHTYGRWLGSKVFNLAAGAVCPSVKLRDDNDYVPTSKSVVFGHHFTSIAGTGPIVGPAIAVMWGWLPALLWVVFGSIFIGAVHDFGALVVSLRNNGQTVGEISGRLLNKRVRLLFLFVLFLALTIVIAIFGLVIAAVFKQYPAAIFPCLVQIPIAVVIGVCLHRKGVGLLLPSLFALGVMYLTVVFGDWGPLGAFNTYCEELPIIAWVGILLVYSYIASVLPVWLLLQPRDYINSLQLVSALGLIAVGLCVAAFVGGAPPVEGAERQPLEFAAPMVQWDPADAPMIFPFLFITIACGAISGFHCLVSSGTSSKQLKNEKDAQFVGFGSMLTEGFLATLVILACCAGLGLGVHFKTSSVDPLKQGPTNNLYSFTPYFLDDRAGSSERLVIATKHNEKGLVEARAQIVDFTIGENWYRWDNGIPYVKLTPGVVDELSSIVVNVDSEFTIDTQLTSSAAWHNRYSSWSAAGALATKVAAFVDGSANFLKAMGIPAGIAVALMGVLVASFAGTTLDTACRLQRYVVQELARTLLPKRGPSDCFECGYDLTGNESGDCPECGTVHQNSGGMGVPPVGSVADNFDDGRDAHPTSSYPTLNLLNPITWLANKHGATIFAILVAGAIAAMPAPGSEWSVANAGKGGLILWPMFGATNQLLGGLAFLVITFYLWRRGKAIWFVALPLGFMIVIPAWAMVLQLQQWFASDTINIPLVAMAIATLILEAWMLVEAALLFPKAKGIMEAGGEPIPDAS
ncbi:MAG: carbon starvation protein A [Phycisphaeraceae bacterium]|nr:carbon starvation protein A [Phycisphaeraceae bacterium]